MARIELALQGSKPRRLPLSYALNKLVQPVGIEPTSTVLQTAAMTTSAKVAWVGESESRTHISGKLYFNQLKYLSPLGCLMSIELIRRESQSLMLPLHHRHHVETFSKAGIEQT